MEVQFKIIGISLIILALIHSIFPMYFNWKHDLKPLLLVNRQMMIVHTFFIALTVLLMGVLCLMNSNDLLETSLGKTICFGFGIFWTIRLVFQFFVYSPKLWKGKRFETIIHIIFSMIWFYLSTFFILCAIN